MQQSIQVAFSRAQQKSAIESIENEARQKIELVKRAKPIPQKRRAAVVDENPSRPKKQFSLAEFMKMKEKNCHSQILHLFSSRFCQFTRFTMQ